LTIETCQGNMLSELPIMVYWLYHAFSIMGVWTLSWGSTI